jgi:hypothetical protein
MLNLNKFNLMLSYIFGAFAITLEIVGLIVENVNKSQLTIKNGVICQITGYSAMFITILLLILNVYPNLPDNMYTKVLTSLAFILYIVGLLFLIAILSSLRLTFTEISADYLIFSITTCLLSILLYAALMAYTVKSDLDIVKQWNNVLLQAMITGGIIFFFTIYVQYNILLYFQTSG